ncbi:MAG: hypothetical protein E3J21_25435 [Anaerolineales bacterium]|nr:MAG: hypothetical protein E3J21_25435 [Anaerolineales bacterium]
MTTIRDNAFRCAMALHKCTGTMNAHCRARRWQRRLATGFAATAPPALRPNSPRDFANRLPTV